MSVLLYSFVTFVLLAALLDVLIVLTRPFAYLRATRRFSRHCFAIDDVLRRSRLRGVVLLEQDISCDQPGRIVLAYAAKIAPMVHLVMLDSSFVRMASTAQLMFVIAHEIGHHKMGHTSILGAIGRATVLALCSGHLERWQQGDQTREAAADEYARLLTGIPSQVLQGIYLRTRLRST